MSPRSLPLLRPVSGLIAALFCLGPALAAPDGGVPDGGVPDANAPADVAPAADSPTPELDAAIGRRLRSAFTTIEALRGVRVEVLGGVVTLRGEVPSATARESASAVAHRVDGVLYVQDLLDLAESGAESPREVDRTEADERIASQLRAIYSNAPDLEDVTVQVARGVVQLGGAAPGERAIESAEKVAAGLDGVVYVSNRVALEVADVGDRVGPVMGKLREQARHGFELLPVLGIALAVFIAFYLLARLLRSWRRPFEWVAANAFTRGIIRQFVFAAVLLVGLLLALEIVGATAIVGAVLGTAGVLGLALGFALQDIVQNYISGVMLSLRQPFEPRDFVQIGDSKGIIIRLTTRETLLMTLDGNHLRIPNATVFGATLINYTRNPERRFDFEVGVGTEVDLVLAQKVGLDVLTEMPGVLDDPGPKALVEALGDSTVVLRFYGWVDQRHNDFSKTRSVAVRRVKVAFDEAGIAMPSPTYRIERVPSADAISTEAPSAPSAPTAPPEVTLDPATVRAVDDISVERVIEEKVDAERAADDEDLLSTRK